MAMPQDYHPRKFDSLTVDATAGGVTWPPAYMSTYQPHYVIADLEDAEIRYTVDGTAPTTTVGHKLDVGDRLILEGNEVPQFKAIRTGGVSGALKYTMYS